MANQTEVTSVEKASTADGKKQKYEFPGLKDQEVMPVEFGGLTYDLKTISDKDAEILIKAGFPHIAKVK